VPLTTADTTPCPSCQHVVSVPEQHRAARRDTELVLTNEAAARRWLDRAGREPSKVLSAFTFLDGGAFWGGVFPVLFLPLGVCSSTMLVPAVMAAVAHVRIVDVWDDTSQTAVSIGLPFVVLLVGLLLGGFARKRTLARAGLQAALAARAPVGVSGVWGCRACGAPLAIAPTTLSARCDYCQADNLVRLSQGRVDAVRSRRDKLASIVRRAEQDWKSVRADLRTSLVMRTIFGLGLIALPTVPILASTPSHASLSDLDLTKPPNQMPSFEAHRKSSWTDPCTREGFSASVRMEEPCDEAGCRAYVLTSPLAEETLEVQGRALPAGTRVCLEPRKVRMLDALWAAAPCIATESDEQLVHLPIAEGGWYRLHLAVPGTARGQFLRFCVRQAPASH
jgi:hypothetical protein